MNEHPEHEALDGARVTVTIEETAKGPRQRVRVTDQATDELCEATVRRAVHAFRRAAAELAGEPERPFKGEKPRP